jgi:hypothetical protein
MTLPAPIPTRHPGLDPGPTFSMRLAAKTGGCRIKSGMTKYIAESPQ